MQNFYIWVVQRPASSGPALTKIVREKTLVEAKEFAEKAMLREWEVCPRVYFTA